MSGLSIATIVEGHGDVEAVPTLLHRLLPQLGLSIGRVLPPIRQPRDRLLDEDRDDLAAAVGLARAKLRAVPGDGPVLILLLVDSEGECAKRGSLGPILLERLETTAGNCPAACVVANVMFETWFAAGWTAEHPILALLGGEAETPDPEAARLGKGWVKRRMPLQRYRETTDQKKLTALMDLAVARERSRSFDKLCRVLQAAA